MPSRSAKPAWQNTWLWKTLAKRAGERGNDHASELLPTMELWMRRLDTVLAKGGTAPADFTLHDADHALRVAHRMEELLTPTIRRNLSDYELALLLLAAYGHDIGMTPERGKVTAHHRHLFHPDQGILSAEEQAAFQEYLDEPHTGQPVALPLSTSLADLNLADELVAFYVRQRHNDWSAEWLQKNLGGTGEGFGFLPGVVEILIRLCTSHHLDVRQLGKSSFDPFLSTGPGPQLVHLRHLACLLRLADILENDPERTPAVLLRHRGLADRKRSLLHWQKNHALAIDLRGDRLHFQARPRSAVAHRALLDLKDWIDHELHGIASFGERLPAEYKVGKTLVRRDWHLAPAVTHDIRPADDSYEYIDGAFRPDTGRLLQLLSGEQLYGNPLHAVRELLQNAFDAVREKIARKRLEPHIADPADRKWEEILGNQEHVTLTLRPGEHGEWLLICEDSGVGLTRDLINKHVLVSGTGRRHAIRQLERDCEVKGFRPGLTGQFGIGVLSYFMLADEVTLETTRYQGCGDGVESWHFTTRGVGSFGELKKLSANSFPSGGTRVTWMLKKSQVGDAAKFHMDLLSYLKTALIRIPCNFELRDEASAHLGLSWKRVAGWVRSTEDCLAVASDRMENLWTSDKPDPGSSSWLSSEDRAIADQIVAHQKDLLEFARRTLRCETREIQVAGVGVARLVLCWFELAEGRSLSSRPADPRRYSSEGSPSFEAFSGHVVAWKGIKCDIAGWKWDGFSRYSDFVCSVNLDLVLPDSGKLSVSREGISFPDADVSRWLGEIEKVGNEWADEVLAGGSGHYYEEINRFHRKLPLNLEVGKGWFLSNISASLGPLPSSFAFGDGRELPDSFKVSDGKVIPRLPNGDWSGFKGAIGLRLAVYKGSSGNSSGRPILCRFGGENHASPQILMFPQEWHHVCLFEAISDYAFLNPLNPVINLLPDSERELISSRIFFPDLDSKALSMEIGFATKICRILKQCLHFDNPLEQYEWELTNGVRDLEHQWSQLAAATGVAVADLQLGGISRRERNVMIRAIPPKGEPHIIKSSSLLPPVTDPKFLLYQVENPA